jgi:hypothetical protein
MQTTCLVNSCIVSWTELVLLIKFDSQIFNTRVYCPVTIILLLQLKFYVLQLQGTPWQPCFVVIDDIVIEEQVVIHIVHSKLQCPSKMALVYVTFVTTVPVLLLLDHLWIALVCYGSMSRPIYVYKLFALFWAIVLTLRFSILIWGTPHVCVCLWGACMPINCCLIHHPF